METYELLERAARMLRNGFDWGGDQTSYKKESWLLLHDDLLREATQLRAQAEPQTSNKLDK
jgi:hypothetical protein